MDSGVPRTLEHLSGELRELLIALRDQLREVLRDDLIGLYTFGSIAFPGFEPYDVDIDIYAFVRNAPRDQSRKKLENVRRVLAGRFRYGKLLDGLVITLDQARRREPPADLITGARDDAWALHREHFHRGACIVLHGPDPRQIVPSASWTEIRDDLDEQLDYVRKRLARAPMYCVLNLCRLIYTWETGTVAVSKVAAAEWALQNLPSNRRPLIKAALRRYRGRAADDDDRLLRKHAKAFYAYASS